jgi:hypothetical protein
MAPRDALFLKNKMMQATKQAPKIEKVLEDVSQYYEDYLGYKPENTTLTQIAEEKWQQFTEERGLNPSSRGIYLPRNQTAIVRDENPLSLFHEYFGHGLYCEQSLEGRKLVDLERELLEEERTEFENRKFTLEDLRKFRQQNPIFQELDNLRQRDLSLYEGFAVWSEYFLSEKLDLKKDFERKYDVLSESDQKGLQDIVNFSKQWGPLATFYAFGMARRTTPERIRTLLGEIYGERLDSVKLAMLYGSRKEFSDIDVFLLSDSIESFYSPWLDIRAIKTIEVEKQISLLDPKVTDPLFIGQKILGSKKFLERLKDKVNIQPITPESITYNQEKSTHHQDRSRNNSLGKTLMEKNKRSSTIYKLNALKLSQGEKPITAERIMEQDALITERRCI